MAKEKVGTEEVKTEETEQSEQSEDTGIPKEVLEAHKTFDDKIDSDDTAATEKDSDEENPEKEAEDKSAKEADDDKPAEKAEEDAAGKAGDEKAVEKAVEQAVEQTAEEKEIEKEAEALEKAILAADQKEVDAKVAEEAEKKVVEKKASKEKAADEDKPYDCGLDPDEFDTEVIAQLNKQGQATLDSNKAFREENADLRNIVLQQANQRYADWLDSKIMALGEDFHEVFGEGEFEDLEPASVPFENRMKLGDRMDLVSKTYQKLDKAVPSRTKLFNLAVSYLHKEIINKEKTDEETVDKLKERSSQVIGKGSKKSSKLSATAEAKKVQDNFDMKLDEDD